METTLPPVHGSATLALNVYEPLALLLVASLSEPGAQPAQSTSSSSGLARKDAGLTG